MTLLHAERGGAAAGPVVVLLHGIGATGAVWQPLCALLSQRWIAFDLPGHGASPPVDDPSIAGVARATAAAVLEAIGSLEPCVLLGHSYGATTALAIASGRFGIQPQRVFALGIKTHWSESELARMHLLASKPARRFATLQEAVAFQLSVTGLAGKDAALAARGVRKTAEGWQLATDPRVNGIEAPDMQRMLADARCPVHLARGADDPMVTSGQMASFGAPVTNISGSAHNAMVEAPLATLHWLQACGLHPSLAEG